MTRHRKPEEWIEAILEAAASEIAENGYLSLTMEAIARRTELSKGGIYRFFANKSQLALALFTRCYRQALDIDVDEAVAWGLPVSETFFRVILRFNLSDEQAGRGDKTWIQLLPEVVRDERFRLERERLLEKITDKFGDLALRLSARDGIEIGPSERARIDTAIKLGVALFEGFTIQGSLGVGVREQAVLARMFIEALVTNVLEAGDVPPVASASATEEVRSI